MKRNTGGDPRCFECPLPDCDPAESRCPLQESRVETSRKCAPRQPRNYVKHDGIVPPEYTDMRDYHRQYRREYSRRFKRILIPGLKIKRCDLEVLETACRAKGRTLAQEITGVLEGMANQVRTAAASKTPEKKAR